MKHRDLLQNIDWLWPLFLILFLIARNASASPHPYCHPEAIIDGLAFVPLAERTAKFHWDTLRLAERYEIRLVSESDGNLVVFESEEAEISVDGLIPGVGYRWRVRAFCEDGGVSRYTDWREDRMSFVSFNCGDAFTDHRDGKQYRTMAVGSDCWMAQNLKHHHTHIGDIPMPVQTELEEMGVDTSLVGQFYCWPDVMHIERSYALCDGLNRYLPKNPTSWHGSKTQPGLLSCFRCMINPI